MLNISDLQQIAAKVRNQENSPEVILQPLNGGRNNQVWQTQIEDRTYCVKVYKVDERRRAEREWLALNLLAERAPGIAPLPFWYEPFPSAPLVIMENIAGAALAEDAWSGEYLLALAQALQQIYSVTPTITGYPFMTVGTPDHYQQRFEQGISQLRAKQRDDQEEASLRLLEKWWDSNDREFLQLQAATVFSPGDPNLLNRLWDGEKFRFVDLEYAGWTDRAFDLADTIEHINARFFTDNDWQIFLSPFELNRAERQRLQAARRMFAAFWVLQMWQRVERASEQEGESVRDLWQRQIERASRLLFWAEN